jgi:hypothetical protein
MPTLETTLGLSVNRKANGAGAIHRALGQVADLPSLANLRSALVGRSTALCFGAGVDSTALLIALRAARLRPDLITFADTGGEKPETLAHVARMDGVLRTWGWPTIAVCTKKTNPTTEYTDLEGNCLANETLPSLAFGMKSCSIKWKQGPQDQYIKGAASGPNVGPPHPLWIRTQLAGERIVKLIGYDCGKADIRRSKSLKGGDADFDYVYPLQLIGWNRQACVAAIVAVLGIDLLPIKSACFFCPASKQWELYWLAAHHPDLLERALYMERRALTGRHSRFDEVEFGGSWDELVRNADRFPSSNTTVGLGRSFSWNQWARVNNVVDANFRVRVTERVRFLRLAVSPTGDSHNALDNRSATHFSIPCATLAA